MVTVILAVIATAAVGFALSERVRRQRDVDAARKTAGVPKREAVTNRIIARVSHEIRTPLSGMIGVTDLLLKTGLEGRQRELAEIIRAQGGTLLTILNDILDYSKMEAGRFGLAPADFSLRALIDSTAIVFGEQARAKGIGLDVHVDPSLPDFVHGDGVRLRQVLDNLLSNAVKFTNAGSIALRVDRVGDDSVRFEVADTGIGIGADAARVLFQPFMQADEVGGRGGTGLGLAIAKSLVELMGGEIGCRAERSGGSTFWFSAKLSPAQLGVAAQSPELPPTQQTFMGRYVLVAEDNEINRMVTRALLEEAGCRVDVVVSGGEAIEACAHARYDLVLMDCQMPDVDGYAATRAIREAEMANRHVPIVALTARALNDEAQRCRAAGMDDCLTKPADAEAIGRVLAQWTTDVVSPQTLADLERRSPAVLRTVIDHYVGGIPTDMASLRGAVAREDRDRVQAIAHDLAGSALVVGAHGLARLLREGERGATSLALDGWLAKVDDEQRRVLDALVQRSRPAASSSQC